MDFRVLAVGDVCGDAGVRLLTKSLRRLKKDCAADFCVVNGENAAVVGILPRQAEAILEEAGRMLCNEHDEGAEMWRKITYEILPANAELLHRTYLLRT